MIEEIVKICGCDKAEILKRLLPLDNQGVDFDVEENDLDAKITMRSSLDRSAFSLMRSKVYLAFEEDTYANEDITLEEMCMLLLKRNQKTVSTAESLTGGMVASRLISVPGASNNFYEGIVCYNKLSKVQRLHVNVYTISRYGTISGQTAKEMVKGLLEQKDTNIGVSTTGLAGPLSDEGKPVGLVYFGVGEGDYVVSFEKHLKGNRDQIRKQATNMALFYLICFLKGNVLRML